MFKELLETILELKAPQKIEITKYGNYTFQEFEAIYDKSQEKYVIKEENIEKTKVSSLNSFISFIKEENRRRNNQSGNKSTVIINNTGGLFISDTDFNKGICEFNRTLSQQWTCFKSYKDKTLDHEEFLYLLSSLYPSIEDFNYIYRQFVNIRIIGKSEVTSNPIFVKNEAEIGFKIKYALEGGATGETILPESFKLNLPYSKGSSNTYELNVKILILNNANNKIVFKILCPEYEQIEELAIFNESEILKNELKEMKELLILESY